MTLTIIFDYLLISTIASIAINTILRNFAANNKFLIDIPDRNRKFHKNATPVTGGLGIIIALLISGKIYFDLNNLSDKSEKSFIFFEKSKFSNAEDSI